MKKSNFFIKMLIIFFLYNSIGEAKESSYFIEGKKYFERKEFDKSKILFERDLVFNPKSEKSYLFLAKIFEKDENDEEQEHNLNNVLLLNPKNEEAIYLLAALNIKKSDFSKAKELIDTLEVVCEKLCPSKKGLLEKLES